jgi:hypothetical protein
MLSAGRTGLLFYPGGAGQAALNQAQAYTMIRRREAQCRTSSFGTQPRSKHPPRAGDQPEQQTKRCQHKRIEHKRSHV